MARTDDLYAAVYANPADDAPRVVLADHLQEQGDPRGELIALQLARLHRKPSAAATRRERALLAAHQTAWLGPLAGTVSEPSSVWARGFLDTAVAELQAATPADPRWNTVRTLRLVGARHVGHPKLLAAGCFAALTELGMVDLAAIGPVLDGKRKPPLVALSLLGPSLHGSGATRWPASQVKLVERLVELPALDRLTLRVQDHPWDASQLAWLFASPIAHRIHHLGLSVHMPLDVAGCLRGAAALAQLASFTLAHDYVDFRFARGTDGALSALTVVWNGVSNNASALTQVAAPLRALPVDALTAFRFDHPKGRWAAAKLQPIRNAVARQRRI